jgi:hypothetical protein
VRSPCSRVGWIRRAISVAVACGALGCSKGPASGDEGALARGASSAGTTEGSARSPTEPPPEGASWLLSGSEDERFARVARHLRGFDLAMAETGYRYGELYWAGRDANWDYAMYQAGKIRTAVTHGVERRPKRAASARMLEAALKSVEDAIEAKSAPLFAERFETLTSTCNACHAAERVAFVHVRPPTVRASLVGPPPGGDGP